MVKKINGLIYKGSETKQLDLAGIFVQIGLVPNTEFLKDSDIELSLRGETEIGARGETSVPGIFSVGDVTTVPYK